jgi:hypothetical protein
MTESAALVALCLNKELGEKIEKAHNLEKATIKVGSSQNGSKLN